MTPKKGSPPTTPRGGVARPAPQPGQVGRRPSNPGLLAFIGLMWIVAGVVVLVMLRAGWKLVPGVVFIGVGLFYFRGAIVSTARRGGPEA